jgi:hypothetical protein
LLVGALYDGLLATRKIAKRSSPRPVQGRAEIRSGHHAKTGQLESGASEVECWTVRHADAVQKERKRIRIS